MVATIDADQPAATVTLDGKFQWTDAEGATPIVAKDIPSAAFAQITNGSAAVDRQQILVITLLQPGSRIRILTTVANTPTPTFGVQISFR